MKKAKKEGVKEECSAEEKSFGALLKEAKKDERVSTGIPGLDKMIEGGYPKNSVILISGEPGTGKSLFCLQYLYEGARNGEFGIYLSFEEDVEDLKEAAKKLGMDLNSTNKVKIIKIENLIDIPELGKLLQEEIKKNKAKRLVIDSISSLEILASTLPSVGRDVSPIKLREGYVIMPTKEAVVRKFLYNLVKFLKSLGVTTLLTSEAYGKKYSRAGVMEFIADGVIKLSAEAVGDIVERSIRVIKMRKTKADCGIKGIKIEKGGIRIA